MRAAIVDGMVHTVSQKYGNHPPIDGKCSSLSFRNRADFGHGAKLVIRCRLVHKSLRKYFSAADWQQNHILVSLQMDLSS